MLRHNLLLIYRSFKKFKSTFLINLIGLSTGLACALLIFLWVRDEMRVDKFHEKDSRLYQVMANHHNTDVIITQEGTPDLLAETLADELPEVEYAVGTLSLKLFGKLTLVNEELKLKATGQFASRDFFNIFSYPLLHGEKGEVLINRNDIVISEELATKMFSTVGQAVGKSLEWQLLNFREQATIVGVFQTLPANSTHNFDFVLSYEAWKEMSEKLGRDIHWDNHGPNTYLTVSEGTDIAEFNKKIEGFIQSKLVDSNVKLFVVPFSDSYLHGKFENGNKAGGRIEYVRLFSIIGIFILVIACINFMNLSTAKASLKTREIGIKKTIGASRRTLVFQFLGESTLMSVLSMVFALFLVMALLPQFNLITGKQLSLVIDAGLILPILSIAIFTGLLAGSYPAMYLSGFNPIKVLKGKLETSFGELWARKGLVVFQFVLSVILIVSVLVVYHQIEYVQTRNLGYDKDQIIHFDKDGRIAENEDAFLNEVRRFPGVVHASSIGSIMMGSTSNTGGVEWEGKNPEDIIRFENIEVNYGIIETLGIEMKSGLPFSMDFGTDRDQLIFNEAAIEVMGLKDPVGQTVRLWGEEKRIKGVVKNFHFESLHETVKPLFLQVNPERTMKIMVKIEAGKEKETLSILQNFYKDFNPGYAFEYAFLDQDYQAQYTAEVRIAQLSRYFAGLAIMISCLGLFGLAAFTAERRIKEIGIRKVLGASEWKIMELLSGDFAKMVLVAIVIALPLSYFLIANWLENFAYKIDLEWWYFIGAGILTMMIALLTVSFQSVKAALANPVESLRSE